MLSKRHQIRKRHIIGGMCPGKAGDGREEMFDNVDDNSGEAESNKQQETVNGKSIGREKRLKRNSEGKKLA